MLLIPRFLELRETSAVRSFRDARAVPPRWAPSATRTARGARRTPENPATVSSTRGHGKTRSPRESAPEDEPSPVASRARSRALILGGDGERPRDCTAWRSTSPTRASFLLPDGSFQRARSASTRSRVTSRRTRTLRREARSARYPGLVVRSSGNRRRRAATRSASASFASLASFAASFAASSSASFAARFSPRASHDSASPVKSSWVSSAPNRRCQRTSTCVARGNRRDDLPRDAPIESSRAR